MIHAVRLPSWGFSICRADYYGYRIGIVIGPWLVFLLDAKHPQNQNPSD